MKKWIALILAVVMVLSLAACSRNTNQNENQHTFRAVIVNDYGQMVVAAVEEDDPLYRNCDRVTFNIAGLETIGARVGDRVQVVYDGKLLETYPVQVTALGWSLLAPKETVTERPGKTPEVTPDPKVTERPPEVTTEAKTSDDPEPAVDPIYQVVPGLSLHYNGAVTEALLNGCKWTFGTEENGGQVETEWVHPLLNLPAFPQIAYGSTERMLLQFGLAPDVITVTAWDMAAAQSEDPSAAMSHVMTLQGPELPLLGEGSWLYEIAAEWTGDMIPATGKAFYCFVVINEETSEELITFDASRNGSGSVTATILPDEEGHINLLISGRGEMLHAVEGSMPWQDYETLIETVTVEEGVTTLGSGAFRNHTAITRVLLPEGLTTIHGEALAGCTNLTEITIPTSVKIIKDDVFMGCELLTAIHWQENTYATVEEFLAAFEAAGQSGMTNKEVRSLYDRAVQVMGWFQLMPLSHDGEKTVTVNDMTYYQVTDENVKSMEDLKAAVYGIFDPELANGLLEPEGNPAPYIEMNDKLYVLPADRGTDLYKGQEELSWTYESTESITVTVRVEDLDVDLTTVKGYSRHTFTLERAEGAWVFTRFELVR